VTNIYDVAKKSGYSITTVSKILNNYPNVSVKAKQRVMETVEELGYIPNSSARTLASNKSNMIGVVFAEHLGIGMAHPFFGEVIEGFRKQVELYNYDLLFVSRTIESNKNYHEHLRRRGVDGIVVVSMFADDKESKVFKASDIPAVFIDMNEKDTNSVYSDNFSGGIQAVNHFYENGHRKIAHISGNNAVFPAGERTRGFRAGMEKCQLPIKEGYIVDGGYFSYEGGRVAMMKLLSLSEMPTAVFVSGDEMAFGAIKAIKEAGLRVPEDISVIGFDDISLADHVEPPLTTIRQDKRLIGQQSAVLLLDEINGVSKDHHTKVIPVRLVKRRSG